jgi:hypothetical protein
MVRTNTSKAVLGVVVNYAGEGKVGPNDPFRAHILLLF